MFEICSSDTINNIMNWIHGHDCIHNLIVPQRYLNEWGHRDIRDYERLIQSSLPLTWAVHSFSVDESNSYDLVCEELGYVLPKAVHPWNSLNTRELWTVLCSFGWRDHIQDIGIDAVVNPEYIYTRWYSNIFQDYISRDRYWNTVVGRS